MLILPWLQVSHMTHIRRMPSSLALLVLAFALGSLPAWSQEKRTFAADTFFAEGSSTIDGEENDKLDQLRCRIGDRRLMDFVAVGHALPRESHPDRLATARAEAVKRWMLAHTHWDPANILAEGRGTRAPLKAYPGMPAMDVAKNRRVEIEVIFGPGPSPGGCDLLAWQKAFLAPAASGATVVARSLVRSGWVDPVRLYQIAFLQRRQDLIDALAAPESGIVLSPEQYAKVARQGLEVGNLDYFRHWLIANARQLSEEQASDLFLASCRSEGGEVERADLVRLLYSLGLRVRDERVLRCAVEKNAALLTEAYLETGSAGFMTADVIVQAGRRPAILEQLLARGADPKSRTEYGTTLFHTVRLSTVDDVKRLLNWGLDINAKGRTFPSNPVTTPLKEASRYANTSVLDFMKQAGADVKDERIGTAGPNVEAQAWLVRNGASFPKLGDDLVMLAAQQGASTVPVFLALKERGLNLDTPNVGGRTALSTAIRRYSVELVSVLIELGVDVRNPAREFPLSSPKSPLEYAEGLSAQVCVPPPSAKCIDSQDLSRRKSEIVRALRAAGA